MAGDDANLIRGHPSGPPAFDANEIGLWHTNALCSLHKSEGISVGVRSSGDEMRLLDPPLRVADQHDLSTLERGQPALGASGNYMGTSPRHQPRRGRGIVVRRVLLPICFQKRPLKDGIALSLRRGTSRRS